MASSLLDHLLARIVDSGLLDDPVAENGLVYGRATIDAAGAVVTVNVDPELEDDEETLDDDALLEAITRILSVSETRWRAVIDEVADDIDEAVDDEPVLEQIDLRDDLEATSVVVFADAVLIAFDAPKQFPDSRILVQLDDDLDVANIEVRDRAEVETVEVDDIDDLLDGLSGDDR
ncbi:cytochrome C5 [Microbacterium sp.]